jgi:ribose transport system ATP-binding protein
LSEANTSRQGAADSEAPVLQIRALSKQFGGVRALDNVDLSVGRQEVHGLLGQNGSGKSTLIKILAGFNEPDPGARLAINGRDTALPLPPGGFREHGISFVHQHLGLIPSLTVLENLLASDLATESRWRINWGREAERAEQLFQSYHLPIDPRDPVSRLTPVQRALLAIVRAFDQLQRTRARADSPGLLVLDEPTPFLPADDVEQLFTLVRDIVRNGASVIFVSHDIDEVLQITDRATVLRDGRVAGAFETRNVTKDQIVEMIVGRRVDLEHLHAAVSQARGEPAVTISGLSGGSIEAFSVALAKGEVLGLTGLIGSGYDEIGYLAYGATRAVAGALSIDGKTFALPDMSPRKAIEAGCVLIPADRPNAGAVGSISVLDNISLPVLSRVTRDWAIRDAALEKNATALAEQFDIRPRDPALLFSALSGGNQQKVLLAKWLQMQPRVIWLDEPTQGVDVGAREQVFDAIREAARAGACVVCASSDHEQLAAICNRVLVFSRGKVVTELSGGQISKSGIAHACYKSAELTTQEALQ